MVLGRTWVLSSLPRARESVCPHLAGARPRCWSRKTAAGKASVTSLGTIPPGLVMLGHGAAEPQSRTGRIPSEGLDDQKRPEVGGFSASLSHCRGAAETWAQLPRSHPSLAAECC